MSYSVKSQKWVSSINHLQSIRKVDHAVGGELSGVKDAAWRSSLFKWLPVKMAFSSSPAARLSKTTETMTRVPRMQGFPWQTLRSTPISSGQLTGHLRSGSQPVIEA